MPEDYIAIDLGREEKAAILKYADFFIADKTTKSDLLNKRKKWIRFHTSELPQIIGELSYHFNRCKDDYLFGLLDEIIDHLEFVEMQMRRSAMKAKTGAGRNDAN